jgi:macrolide-specific efflux system membrane fusion protein
MTTVEHAGVRLTPVLANRRRAGRLVAILRVSLLLLVGLAAGTGAEAANDESQRIQQVFLKIFEQIEVPARDAGVLTELKVREGQIVSEGELLARVDDSRVRLVVDRTLILLDQARRLASNDLSVKLAGLKQRVARMELNRALESNARFASSVSQTEIDRLTLVAETADLELSQSEFELEEAQHTVLLRESEFASAENEMNRRRITAPFKGTVIEILRRRGEWVEPGQGVVRLIGMSKLRAEGLVDKSIGTPELVGKPVDFIVEIAGAEVRAAGTIVFVSPEVEPVLGRVAIWAEIDNAGLRLRPGLKGDLVLRP